MEKKFNPRWKKCLDDPKRRRLLDPGNILKNIGIEEGQVIVDVGAGTGYFSFPMAELVGDTGRVYAVDINQEMLDTLEQRSKEFQFPNIEMILSSEDKIGLPDDVADMAIMVNVLHELKGTATLEEARRLLKSGGRLVIIDWKKKVELRGPPSFIRLKTEKARSICEDAGFTFREDLVPGPSSFGFIFEKGR